MARRLSSFQKLAVWTTGATYLLILVGGLVRASGAGLGCPDWPRCFGSWIPPLTAADVPPGFDPALFNPTLMWTEYINRLIGITIGLLIFATVIAAVRHHRRTPQILWPAAAALLLVGLQGWLGGVVVEHELEAWIVTVHLLVALLIVSLLLSATVYALFHPDGRASASAAARRPLQVAALALIAMTLAQVALGAQVRGAIDDALLHGTARADALASVGTFDAWHREAALVVAGVAALVGLLVWNRHADEPAIVRSAAVVGGLVVVQVGLGLVMAYGSLTPGAQVPHLGVASLLLGAETVLLLTARWMPEARSGQTGEARHFGARIPDAGEPRD
jgi:cytochrome c oxidase assembly protein subunit 15